MFVSATALSSLSWTILCDNMPSYNWHEIPHRGKGTPRRKVKKVHKTSGTDDKKLQTSLKKLNVQPIQAIEEVNMFKEDGNVIHFAAPKGMHAFLRR